MHIDELFDAYANKITQIHLYQRAVKELAQKELDHLNEYARLLEEKPKLKELSSSYHNVFFRDVTTGEHRRLGHRSTTVEDRQLSVLLHKNKQYQWLLAEAYEEFEDFLEHAYAYAGSVDNNFWPMVDYGAISLSELKDKNFGWYLEQVKSKRDRPQSILNQIRKKRPEICAIEMNNGFKMDLRLALSLIEHLRHIVVHSGGIVTDKNAFVERVLKKVGLHNNGRHKDEHVEFINSFFGVQEYEKTVLLLEIRIDKNIPLDIHISRFDWLSECMTAYAYLLATTLRHGNQPGRLD